MNFYKFENLYPFLGQLREHAGGMLREIEEIDAAKWTDWPEKHLYKDHEWRIIPFLGFGMEIRQSRELCPHTYDLAMALPGVQTALISRVPAGMSIEPHRGWAELANNVLRCHVVLQTNKKCSLTVDGERRKVRDGQILVFDDSKWHHAVNDGGTDKIVLLLDFPRPRRIPPGESTVEKTPELLEFLESFSDSRRTA